MFILTDVTSLPYRTTEVARFKTFALAVAFVKTNWAVVCLEVDPNHDGCADLITNSGRLYTIQPEGFTLAA